MQIIDIKLEIEKLRTELYEKIESGREEGISMDNKLYKLSTDIDDLIIVYIKII